MSILHNSRLRSKLLAYTFTHPDEKYYVRELAGLIGQDPGNLSRELQKLAVEGLFRAQVRGRIKLYELNKKYPLFNELKTIIFKTEGVAGALKKLLAGFKEVSLAFIHGSYADGRENSASDIDLVLVGKIAASKITGPIRVLESQLNREINFTIYLEQEFNQARQKPGSFLNLVLKKKTVILKGNIDV